MRHYSSWGKEQWLPNIRDYVKRKRSLQGLSKETMTRISSKAFDPLIFGRASEGDKRVKCH